MEPVWDDELRSHKRSFALQWVFESSSEEDEDIQHGGSRPGRAPNTERHREVGAQRLYHDYFSENPTYSAMQFRRRFRVSKEIFNKISDAVQQHDVYFTQRTDCTGRAGLSSFQKLTCAFRMLSYGAAADSVDEYLRIGESTAIECLKRFASAVVACFQKEYLRYPTEDDLRRILLRSEKRGFPGLIGSIDCCKWRWKNCPTAHHGQYQGKEGEPAVTLEAIADDELWIWHAYFGMPGSLNDINVLEASPLSNAISMGEYPPPVEYSVAGERRNVPYWFADGIYPRWPLFVQTISEPTNRKEKLLARLQEAGRKDVERAFGVLQAKWHIIAQPSRLWYQKDMHEIMSCCIILHNMMVESRILEVGDVHELGDLGDSIDAGGNVAHVWQNNDDYASSTAPPGSIAALCAVQKVTENLGEYYKTRRLVMEHLWDRKGSVELE